MCETGLRSREGHAQVSPIVLIATVTACARKKTSAEIKEMFPLQLPLVQHGASSSRILAQTRSHLSIEGNEANVPLDAHPGRQRPKQPLSLVLPTSSSSVGPLGLVGAAWLAPLTSLIQPRPPCLCVPLSLSPLLVVAVFRDGLSVSCVAVFNPACLCCSSPLWPYYTAL